MAYNYLAMHYSQINNVSKMKNRPCLMVWRCMSAMQIWLTRAKHRYRNGCWNQWWPAAPFAYFNPNRDKQLHPLSLRWRHNDHAGVSNHQPHGCLLNRLFRRNSKKTSKLRVTGLCAGNSPGTGEFPAQMASYAENVSIWWRHHVEYGMKLLALSQTSTVSSLKFGNG